ncbi:MAG: deoxyribonuclease V [Anaerolineae bacterium]
MKLSDSHPWNVSPAEAMEIQSQLRDKVVMEVSFHDIGTVAGVDVAFKGDRAQAAAVILDYPTLTPFGQSVVELPVEFPYVPGLLAFREAPAILAALENLPQEADLLIVDGHGLAHPRRLGIASHVGVLLDTPSIGCAKSILCGDHALLGEERGSRALLYHGGEVIGAAVRTREGVNPIYVSIGHKTDLETAIDLVLHCCHGYKLPEPIRWAHRVAGGEKLPGEQAEQLTLF